MLAALDELICIICKNIISNELLLCKLHVLILYDSINHGIGNCMLTANQSVAKILADTFWHQTKCHPKNLVQDLANFFGMPSCWQGKFWS